MAASDPVFPASADPAGSAPVCLCCAPARENLMNPQVELNLAMILFLPWFLILAWAYWAYPRAPRDAARLLADAAALAVATLAAVLSTWWSIHNADPGA